MSRPDKLGGLPRELEDWFPGFKKYGVARGHNSLFHAFFFAHSPAFRRMSKDIRDMYIHNMRRKIATEQRGVADPEFEDLFDDGAKGVAAFLKELGDSSKACGEEIWALLEDKFKVNIVVVYKADGAYKTYCGHGYDALPHHKILLILKLGANHYEPVVVPGSDVVHVTAAFGTGDSRMAPILRRLKLDSVVLNVEGDHVGGADDEDDEEEAVAEDRADEYEELLAERQGHEMPAVPEPAPAPAQPRVEPQQVVSPASDYMASDPDPYVTFIIPTGDVQFLEEVDPAQFISKEAVEFKQYTKDQLTTDIFELTKNKRSVAGFHAMYAPVNGVLIPEIGAGGDINERTLHRIKQGHMQQPFFKPVVSVEQRPSDFKAFFKNIESSANSYTTKRADLYDAQRPWVSDTNADIAAVADDEYTTKSTIEAIGGPDRVGLKLIGAVGYWTPSAKTVVYRGDRVRINALHVSRASECANAAPPFDLQQYIRNAKALKTGDRVTVYFNDAFVTKEGEALDRANGVIERTDGVVIEATLDVVARRADEAVASSAFTCSIEPGCAAFVYAAATPAKHCFFKAGTGGRDVLVLDKADGGLEQTLKWVLPTLKEYVYAARADLASAGSFEDARRVLPFDFSDVHFAYVRPLKDLIEHVARAAPVGKGLTRNTHEIPFVAHRKSRIPVPSIFKAHAAFEDIASAYPELVGMTKDHLRDAKFEMDFGVFVKGARDHGHHLYLRQHKARVQRHLAPAAIEDLVKKQAALDSIVDAALPPNPLLVPVSSLPIARTYEDNHRDQGRFVAELNGKYSVFNNALYKRVFDEWVKIAPIKNGVVDAATLYSQYMPRVPDAIDVLQDGGGSGGVVAYLRAANDQRVALDQIVMLQEWAKNPDAAAADLDAHIQTLEASLKAGSFPTYRGTMPAYGTGNHNTYDGDGDEPEFVVDFAENAGIFTDTVLGTGMIGSHDANEFEADDAGANASPKGKSWTIADIAARFGVVVEDRYLTLADENIVLQLKKRNEGRKKPMSAEQELKFMEETRLREALFVIVVQIQRSMPVIDGMSPTSFETHDLAEFVAQDIDAMVIRKTHAAFIENRPRLAKAVAASIAKSTANKAVWPSFRPPMSTQPISDRTSVKGYVAGLYADAAKEAPLFTLANKRPLLKNACCVRPLDASYQYIKPLAAAIRRRHAASASASTFVDCNVSPAASIVDYGTVASKGVVFRSLDGKRRQRPTASASAASAPAYPPLFEHDVVIKGDDMFELSEQTSLLFEALFDTDDHEISEVRVRLLQVSANDLRPVCAGTEAFMLNGWRDVGLMLFGKKADMPDELVEIASAAKTTEAWPQHAIAIIGQATATHEAMSRVKGSLQDRLLRLNYLVVKTLLVLAWSVDATTFMCDDNQIYLRQLGHAYKLQPLIVYLLRRWNERVKAAFVDEDEYTQRVAMHREKAKNDVISVQNKLSNDEIRLQRELRSRGLG